MSEGGAQDPLRDLGRRLDAAKRALAERKPPAPQGNGGAGGNALAFAWRIGLELVVAIVVSTGIGWAIDSWFGTKPWATIVLFFLGVAAGMVNVWRAVTGLGMAVGYREHGARKAEDAKDLGDEDED